MGTGVGRLVGTGVMVGNSVDTDVGGTASVGLAVATGVLVGVTVGWALGVVGSGNVVGMEVTWGWVGTSVGVALAVLMVTAGESVSVGSTVGARVGTEGLTVAGGEPAPQADKNNPTLETTITAADLDRPMDNILATTLTKFERCLN